MAPDERDAWPPDVEIDPKVFERTSEAAATGAWWILLAVVATVSGLLGAVLERTWG